jgi:nitroreductase
MELYDVMRTTFSAREFTDDPLPDDVLYRILDNARFAASGGNRQGWKVIVVREMATRRAIADLMVGPGKRYGAQVQAGENPWNTIHPTALDADTIERTAPPRILLDPLLDAPLALIVCVDLAVVASLDHYLERVGIASGASIYPFVWNILLAARNEGFGGVPTTIAIAEEDRVQALLGLPKQIAVAAVIPLGKPVKQLTRLRRNPVESFTRLERWDGEPFGPNKAAEDG